MGSCRPGGRVATSAITVFVPLGSALTVFVCLMWIVALALRRPYTFVVMALLIIILTPITILRTPVDIFPEINIPVVSIVWSYTGMSPSEMADRIVSNSERISTIVVNDIEHMESQSLSGVAVIKIFFRPGVNISMAMTQVTGACQTVLDRKSTRLNSSHLAI